MSTLDTRQPKADVAAVATAVAAAVPIQFTRSGTVDNKQHTTAVDTRAADKQTDAVANTTASGDKDVKPAAASAFADAKCPVVTICPFNGGAHWGRPDLKERRHTIHLPAGDHELIVPWEPNSHDSFMNNTFDALQKLLLKHKEVIGRNTIGICHCHCPVDDWVLRVKSLGYAATAIGMCHRCTQKFSDQAPE